MDYTWQTRCHAALCSTKGKITNRLNYNMEWVTFSPKAKHNWASQYVIKTKYRIHRHVNRDENIIEFTMHNQIKTSPAHVQAHTLAFWTGLPLMSSFTSTVEVIISAFMFQRTDINWCYQRWKAQKALRSVGTWSIKR